MSKHGIQINELNENMKSSMRSRIFISLLLVAIGLPCLVLGGWFYFVLIVLVVGLGTYEMVKSSMDKFSVTVLLINLFVMYALVIWGFMRVFLEQDPFSPGFVFELEMYFQNVYLSPFALMLMVGIMFFFVIMKEDISVLDACYLIAMTLVLATAFQSFLIIRFLPFSEFASTSGSVVDTTSDIFKYFHSMLLILYVLFATMLNDIFAYFFGVLFGKTKINPRISPKKTYEGFYWGIACSFVISSAFALIMAAVGFPLLPSLTIDNWYWILLLSLIMPLVGNLGDFTFSAIKRSFNIKDYSNILRSHGGILDRLDSIIFSSMSVVILLNFINTGWRFV